MTEYNTGNWKKIENIGELRNRLHMFPDTIECNIEVRFLETIEEDNDGRSVLSIQFREPEITEF